MSSVNSDIATNGPLTLAWSHFIVLCAGLCTLAIVLSILHQNALYEFAYQDLVRQYEQAYGFEAGFLQLRPGELNLGRWGITRVTPGGKMDRAGMRSGDYAVGTHNSAPELYGALARASDGRPACVVVINIADAQAGTFTNRVICWNGTFDDELRELRQDHRRSGVP